MADARYPRYRFSVGPEMAACNSGYLCGYKLILFPSSALHFSTPLSISLYPPLSLSLSFSRSLFVDRKTHTRSFSNDLIDRATYSLRAHVSQVLVLQVPVSVFLSRRSARRVLNLSRRFLYKWRRVANQTVKRRHVAQ